uniref:Uncharacterized protein n=1 Tax=Sphaerodactylus townsendi TaxID=933632 RepID=A0ACB8EPV2_9SAUR
MKGDNDQILGNKQTYLAPLKADQMDIIKRLETPKQELINCSKRLSEVNQNSKRRLVTIVIERIGYHQTPIKESKEYGEKECDNSILCMCAGDESNAPECIDAQNYRHKDELNLLMQSLPLPTKPDQKVPTEKEASSSPKSRYSTLQRNLKRNLCDLELDSYVLRSLKWEKKSEKSWVKELAELELENLQFEQGTKFTKENNDVTCTLKEKQPYVNRQSKNYGCIVIHKTGHFNLIIIDNQAEWVPNQIRIHKNYTESTQDFDVIALQETWTILSSMAFRAITWVQHQQKVLIE